LKKIADPRGLPDSLFVMFVEDHWNCEIFEFGFKLESSYGQERNKNFNVTCQTSPSQGSHAPLKTLKILKANQTPRKRSRPPGLYFIQACPGKLYKPVLNVFVSIMSMISIREIDYLSATDLIMFYLRKSAVGAVYHRCFPWLG
jgi:hypothetical protein